MADMQHAVFLRSLDGRLCLCPIKEDIQNVLDVGMCRPNRRGLAEDSEMYINSQHIGTGTGVWALDFGMFSP